MALYTECFRGFWFNRTHYARCK